MKTFATVLNDLIYLLLADLQTKCFLSDVNREGGNDLET